MIHQFANNASATLSGAIGAGAVSLNVTAGQGAQFPVPSGSQQYMATLFDAANNIEIVKVTGRAGDAFTIVRAQEGTVALAFAAGDRIEMRLTAAILGNFVQKEGNQTVTGELTVTGGVVGNASTASALDTARTIAITGAMEGDADFDGSGNITIEVEFAGGGLGTDALADDAVTNAKLANMAQGTLKGREAGAGTGNPTDLDISALHKLLGLTGTLVTHTSTVVPAGQLLANGQLVSRVTYPNLYAHALASGNIAASDAAWSAAKGMYSPGDGATTFRLPDIRGMTVRVLDNGAGVDAGRAIGSYQADDNKSHFHTMSAVPKAGTGFGYSGTAGVNGTVTQTNASGGSETRVKSIAYPVCIRY